MFCRNFRDNADLQVMPLAVDIRTEEEIDFIKSAAVEMGLEVKAFSQSVSIHTLFSL